MKRFIPLLLTLLSALMTDSLSAQNLESYKATLATPVTDTVSLRTASVSVREDASATEALSQARQQNPKLRFQGWRVCIYSDNTPQAREGANQAKQLFEEHFAGIPVYDQYASPYFRVSAGNCTTPEEAIILLKRVDDLFPKAFVKQETLSLADLLQ